MKPFRQPNGRIIDHLEPYVMYSMTKYHTKRAELLKEAETFQAAFDNGELDQQLSIHRLESRWASVNWLDKQLTEDGFLKFCDPALCDQYGVAIDWADYYNDRMQHYADQIRQYSNMFDLANTPEQQLLVAKALEIAEQKYAAVRKKADEFASESAVTTFIRGQS